MEIDIRLLSDPDARVDAFVRAQLADYNVPFAGQDKHQTLIVLALYNDEVITARENPTTMNEDLIAGGLLGGTYWGWLHIDILWVREDVRRTGLGSRLMAAAEAEAIRRGCKHAHVDTVDFQAPEFYKKLGYTIWGVLDDLPPAHQRIFFRKDLVP